MLVDTIDYGLNGILYVALMRCSISASHDHACRYWLSYVCAERLHRLGGVLNFDLGELGNNQHTNCLDLLDCQESTWTGMSNVPDTRG